MLSRGARLCEQIIRTSRARRGGVHECGRPYLARRLGCSVRTVSRYVRELREAERLDVTPPPRQRHGKGWRTHGVNVYRLTCASNPAPHVTGPARLRRSGRGDTYVTPSPNGDRVTTGIRPGHPRNHAQTTPAEALAYITSLLSPVRQPA